ncbi:NAD-P-binding protein [Trametopsis cervina]|nr:NAD-P-binding protein [Trametopsis cervina]
MTSLPQIRSSNIATSSALPYTPVAVFVGGTAGVGAAMARAFAQHRNGDAHIVLVGRNRAAAQEVLASFPKETRGEFVECDVALMKNVRETAGELGRRLERLNFLVLSPGIMTLRGRNETPEGLDRKLALHYYARWRFTYEFIPLLQKAVDAKQDAKVMTVLSSIEDGAIDLNDLGLRNYSLNAAGKYASACNNAMIESFAEKYPAMAFTHIFPGAVRTNLMYGSDDWKIRLFSPLTAIVGRAFGVSAEDCAEYMWKGMYEGKNGWFRRDSHGEVLGGESLTHRMWKWAYDGKNSREEVVSGRSLTEEVRRKVWDHTLEVTS